MTAAPPTLQMLADFYRCSGKTLQRLRADGVDITNALAVAQAVAVQRSQSHPMAERLTEILDSITNPEPIS
jgi:hypothetical protein